MIAGAPYAPTNWNEQRFYLRTTPDGLFRIPELIYPFANYINISYKPRFEWVKTGHIQTKTHLQVASDSQFSTILAESNAISGTVFDQLVLPSNTLCYFRVREVGSKGFPGRWSEIRQFTTEDRTGILETNKNPVGITYDRSSQLLKITCNDGHQISNARLFDISGRLYGSYSFDTNLSEIEVNELRSGLYFLSIQLQNLNTITLKILLY
jgi:hypothetical protein